MPHTSRLLPAISRLAIPSSGSGAFRFLLPAALLICLVSVLPAALATEARPFDSRAFAVAQKEGKAILVDVAASWCPVCQAQKPALQKLLSQDKFQDLVVFEVDFDAQKDVLKHLGASRQSTLIVFKGAQEVGRSVGETDAAAIATLLAKAL